MSVFRGRMVLATDGFAEAKRAAGTAMVLSEKLGAESIGRPDIEIVKLAEALGGGLTVVGSRGLGGLRRALVGSVSDSVVRHPRARPRGQERGGARSIE